MDFIIKQHKETWEVPEVDLDLTHYSGHPADIIKKIKMDIVHYVRTPGVSQRQIEIYSAVYNALDYYKAISYAPSKEFQVGDTYISSLIRMFNEDYELLNKVYNSSDPKKPLVVKSTGRIKSPYSFVEKMKEKINEYIDQGSDLSYLNESLRDLIGMRVIVDIPEDVASLGEGAKADYLYGVYQTLMTSRGILRREDEKMPTDYNFIGVNTRQHPDKADDIKLRPLRKGFDPAICDEHGIPTTIYIPETRPYFMELEQVDGVTKDYVQSPKYSGYQSIQVSMTANYSVNIEPEPVPTGIIPPKSNIYSFEYQIRSREQDEEAERGHASHDNNYKPRGAFHRSKVPFFITLDTPVILKGDLYNPENATEEDEKIYRKNELRLRNFGESYYKYTGHTFEEGFGVNFKYFSNTYDVETRNAILAGEIEVIYDEDIKDYVLIDHRKKQQPQMIDGVPVLPNFLACSEADLIKIQHALCSQNKEELFEVFKNMNLGRNLYEVASNDETDTVRITQKTVSLPHLVRVEEPHITAKVHQEQHSSQSPSTLEQNGKKMIVSKRDDPEDAIVH